MKASELITRVQQLMQEHGDFEVYKRSWNHYDAIYEGLSSYELYLSFRNKKQLKDDEAERTAGLIEKYRHPDRWIYDKMDDKSVVGVIEN